VWGVAVFPPKALQPILPWSRTICPSASQFPATFTLHPWCCSGLPDLFDHPNLIAVCPPHLHRCHHVTCSSLVDAWYALLDGARSGTLPPKCRDGHTPCSLPFSQSRYCIASQAWIFYGMVLLLYPGPVRLPRSQAPRNGSTVSLGQGWLSLPGLEAHGRRISGGLLESPPANLVGSLPAPSSQITKWPPFLKVPG